MKNYFLFEDILLEGRLEDIKKKYQGKVREQVIDNLSQNDPSGTNKYLDKMVEWYSFAYTEALITKHVNLFHKNINKINKELIDEIAKSNLWYQNVKGENLKVLNKILNSPKDINSYEWAFFVIITDYADKKLSKSEIKKLEAEVLLDNDDLKILIPKSHQASCWYGSGTRWCTTSPDPYRYNQYTSSGTLIYVIDKKSGKENDWYKTAFHIKKDTGNAQAYDAPDTPTPIERAAQSLGKNWELIRDTIIEYLFKNNLKGIENFYFGADLISWLESKGLDPLKSLSKQELMKRIGLDELLTYLQKRNINIYEYFTFREIMFLYEKQGKRYNTFHDLIKDIWDQYKSNNINPLLKMFTNKEDAEYIVDAISHKQIPLDDFLHLFSENSFIQTYGENTNVFGLVKDLFGSKTTDGWWGSNVGQIMMKIFNNDIDLIYGYANNIGVNLFQELDVKAMNLLISREFGDDKEKGLEFIFDNLKDLKGPLVNYGFKNDVVLNYVKKSPNYKQILQYLLHNKLIKDLSLSDMFVLYENKEEAFSNLVKNMYGEIYDWDETIEDFFYSPKIRPYLKNVFPTVGEFDNFISKKRGDDWNTFHKISAQSLWVTFYDKDYYELYVGYLESGNLEMLNSLILIKAYEDAPVGEKTGLRELMLDEVYKEMKSKYRRGQLNRGEKTDTITLDSSYIEKLSSLFGGYGTISAILNEEESALDELDVDYGNYMNYIHEEQISNIIKEHLMLHFRNEKITLSTEFLDFFEEWAENIDEGEGTFSFKLYDERIYGMSEDKFEIIIKHSDKLRKIQSVLIDTFEKSYKNLIIKEIKGVILTKVSEVFGGDYSYKKLEYNKEEIDVIQFEYNYLMEHITAYANNYIWDQDGLPEYVIELIDILMGSSLGDFNGYLDFDVDYYVGFTEPNDERLISEFTENLYYKLRDIEYD